MDSKKTLVFRRLAGRAFRLSTMLAMSALTALQRGVGEGLSFLRSPFCGSA
jgi:hypothetical protein